MMSIEMLTRKLEETHEEIVQVRGQVVGALRSFYASSSTLTADEAVKIASKWGASHSFPMDGDDVDNSDLQEKMRRLNVALLDAVGRLQLEEGEDIAPEAQLLLDFTQREELKQQVQQAKNMLALIEQLTEMDRLLSDVDESIDKQRFVSAAEGAAEVERLVQGLVEGQSDAEDAAIVRLVRMQLLRKKNRLTSQLNRYFACTAVWQDGALKVMDKPFPDATFATDKIQKETLRQEFWTACDVLDILTPKLKDLAKAISQHLIKPMLLSLSGSVTQNRVDGGTTLKLTVENEANDATDTARVQEKFTIIVTVLEFIYEELFGGNSELMAQLGEFVWKIPGNLEAQMMNLLQDKLPQDAAALDEFRNAVHTALNNMEEALTSIGFTACSNSELQSFVNQLNQLHSKKRRQNILSTGRDFMRQRYHDSMRIARAAEKCNLNPSIGSGKKGKGSKEASSTPSSSDNDDIESSSFQMPDYRVTVCAHQVVELVHQTMSEACTAGGASAKLFFQTARDLFLLFRTIVPTLYEDDIANDSRTCMLYHNDCLYITHHILVMGHLYKQRLQPPLNQTATMIDMVPAFRDAGERALTLYATAQTDSIMAGLNSLPSLGTVNSERDITQFETFVKSALYKLNGISSSWREGLPPAVYNKIMSRMVEPLVKKFVVGVLAETKISEDAGAHLHHLLSLLLECEELFDSPSQAAKYAPSIERLSKLTAVLMEPLTTVRDKFNAGDLNTFTPKELTVLVQSLYRESQEKKAFLQELAGKK